MMSGYALRMSTQIAVKLPEELVRALDRLVAGGTFASRSQAVRRGVEALVAAQREEALGAQYADAMVRHPSTPAELADATRLAVDAIEDEPWERWW